MSIFSRIRDAIFHKGASPQSHPSQAGTSAARAPQSQPSSAGNRPTGGTQPTAQTSAAHTQASPVDVESVLEQRAAANAQKLNWRTSIVDLMKLLDLDPTLQNRKELAGELGYTGDTNDSAAMNIWLHKQVMRKLAESGGKVPDSLRN